MTNRAYTIQTAAYIIGGVCFIVVAVLDTGAWTVVLGIIGLVMLVLALWRWYSVSAPRTSAQATHQRLDASWVDPHTPIVARVAAVSCAARRLTIQVAG